MSLNQGTKVRHNNFGIGTVKYDDGETVGIRFEHGLEECAKEDIEPLISIADEIRQGKFANPIEVIARIQAETIQSINDTWGVFSLSRIDLLPHQLWVCKRVTERLPARWLIADDVGLGKTIEAGLILWPLLANKSVRRLLILCPASLVAQWQERLRIMFDIRLIPYVSEMDTQKSDFWNTHHYVVASLQTLRMDNDDRLKRLLESPPWDLVMVDEAHHLNAEKHSGQTLGYKLIDNLQKNNLIHSMIFFTGTPHRGKNFGFLSLLKLLKPEHFSPDKDLSEQLPYLSEVMIRNNKHNVTDLRGNKIFFPPKVRAEIYSYSPEESIFYNMLTEFIITGKTYASTLSEQEGKSVMLVLITMQKLASSSVAAIRRALKNRLANLSDSRKNVQSQKDDIVSQYRKIQNNETLDQLAELEEQITDQLVILMKNEEQKIEELIESADRIKQETKIRRIVDLVENTYQDKSIVFFTEYKATQSLLISALIQRFGNACVTFINGDDCAVDVINQEGKTVTLREKRENATEKFNSGKVRFLVSTEAAGEGIDLQEQCHTLFHVDLPWNPMRMHQRVGRLNRYGQTKQVEVISLRNPDTVESLIWEKLDAKLKNIMHTFGAAMDDPEDLMQIVLGMTEPSVFDELHTNARNIPREKLTEWFDQKTSSFGGKDVMETVKAIVGNSEKFNYQQTCAELPNMDLPDIKPFFISMLKLNKRKISEENNEMEFITPEGWCNEPGILPRYKNVVFNRKAGKQKTVMGIGHKIMNKAVEQAKNYTGSFVFLPSQMLDAPLFIFKLNDRITDTKIKIRKKIAGLLYYSETEMFLIKRDSDILRILNDFSLKEIKNIEIDAGLNISETITEISEKGKTFLTDNLKDMNMPFQYPNAEIIAAFWPLYYSYRE